VGDDSEVAAECSSRDRLEVRTEPADAERTPVPRHRTRHGPPEASRATTSTSPIGGCDPGPPNGPTPGRAGGRDSRGCGQRWAPAASRTLAPGTCREERVETRLHHATEDLERFAPFGQGGLRRDEDVVEPKRRTGHAISGGGVARCFDHGCSVEEVASDEHFETPWRQLHHIDVVAHGCGGTT
jgi:hypothetical protein